jgi:catechol 2,3-dioxygenase-like lactoylglutathione lyase family enzyme
MADAASDPHAAGPIRIREIDHVVLRVRDVDRAMAFYRALGCTLERVQERIGLWQLRAGRSLIDLVPLDGELGRAGGAGPGREGRNVDHVCLRVAPWDEKAIRDHLARHGIAAEATKLRFGAEGSGPSIYVADPDGNTIELRGPPAA